MARDEVEEVYDGQWSAPKSELSEADQGPVQQVSAPAITAAADACHESLLSVLWQTCPGARRVRVGRITTE